MTMAQVRREMVLACISLERDAQDRKWGAPPFIGRTHPEWLAILSEEHGEAAMEAVELHFGRKESQAELWVELVQCAAVCVSWLEDIAVKFGEEPS